MDSIFYFSAAVLKYLPAAVYEPCDCNAGGLLPRPWYPIFLPFHDHHLPASLSPSSLGTYVERTKTNRFTISIYIKKIGVLRDTARATTTSQPINKWAGNEQNANLVVFGQKILFFTGQIKSFVTRITENPPRHLNRIDFWPGVGSNRQKMPIFDPKWPKMHILDQFWPFLGQKS